VEFDPLGVRVNAVGPGYVQTPIVEAVPEDVWKTMTGDVPARRAAHPDEVADAVLWLLSDDASYVNGHPLVVAGVLLPTMHRRLDVASP
jgi:3-oxoacyl-[acyl-carrier protein] reductase